DRYEHSGVRGGHGADPAVRDRAAGISCRGAGGTRCSMEPAAAGRDPARHHAGGVHGGLHHPGDAFLHDRRSGDRVRHHCHAQGGAGTASAVAARGADGGPSGAPGGLHQCGLVARGRGGGRVGLQLSGPGQTDAGFGGHPGPAGAPGHRGAQRPDLRHGQPRRGSDRPGRRPTAAHSRVPPPHRPRHPGGFSMIRQLHRGLDTSTKIGLFLVGLTVLVALLAPVLAPYDPVATDAKNALAGISWQHPLGTDQYGRDVLSRTLLGGRFALLISFLATTFAVIVGTAVGTIAAFYGRWVDGAITRVVDSILAVPAVLALLLIVSVFGNSVPVLVLAISVVYVPAVALVVRGATRPVLTSDYV